MASRDERLARLLLALGGGLLVFAILLTVTSGLTFFADEWNVILRPDWSPDSLFTPLNEHIYVGPVIAYKILLAVFGMDSTVPFRVANIAFLLSVAGLTYVLVSRRLGLAAGVLIASLLVFLGPAWEDLLWPAGISFMGAMVGGLGAFIAIERETRRSDIAACALLAFSVAFSTLGLAFVVGAAVDVALRGGRRLERAFIPAIPIALYLLWYLAYGRDVESQASIENLLGAPLYVWDAASSAVASLTGLSGIDARSLGSDSSNGQPLLVAGILGGIWAVGRRPELLSRRLWMFLATALFFWTAAAINEVPGREPGASRYQLIGAVLVILVAAELLRGSRLSRGWFVLAVVVIAAAVLSNAGALRQGEHFLRDRSDANSASLAALDGAREEIPGDFALESAPDSPFTSPAPADQYFAAVDRWGAPIADPSEALNGPEPALEAADRFLATVLQLRLVPLAGAAGQDDLDCVTLALDASGRARSGSVPPGGAVIRSDAPLDSVRVARWSRSARAAVNLGRAPAGATQLTIPSDDFARPWRFQIKTAGRVESCRIDQ